MKNRIDHTNNIRQIIQECEKERNHVALPLTDGYTLNRKELLELRTWLQYQKNMYIDLQRQQEEIYLGGDSDDDGLALCSAANAYRLTGEVIENLIRLQWEK